MLTLDSPTDIELETFDRPIRADEERPIPDTKQTIQSVTGIEVVDPYRHRRNDKYIQPTITIHTEETTHKNVHGFARFKNGPETNIQYTMYKTKKSVYSNSTDITVSTVDADGFSIIEVDESLFGKSKMVDRLRTYHISDDGYLSTQTHNNTVGIIKDKDTGAVLYHNMAEYKNTCQNASVKDPKPMTVTTGSGKIVSGVYNITNHKTEDSNLMGTFVCRDKNGNQLYITNKIKDVDGKRYTVYQNRTDMGRVSIHRNVLGFSQKSPEHKIRMVNIHNNTPTVSYRDPGSIQIYDHFTECALDVDNISLLSELESDEDIGHNVQNITESVVESAVVNLSYSDDDLLMYLKELSKENGVLTNSPTDGDYMSLVDNDPNLNIIVQFLTEYNMAAFLRITSKHLSDDMCEELQQIELGGVAQPVHKTLTEEVCV